MATTKFIILKDFTSGGPVKEGSQTYFKVQFKKGDIVEGEEVDNPDYKIGLVGGGAPKGVKVVTPQGSVFVSNTPSLGPNGLFIEPYKSALPEGLPEVVVKKDSEVNPIGKSGTSTTGLTGIQIGVIAGLVIGIVTAFLLKGQKYSYYAILLCIIVGGVAGNISDNKMKKIA